MLCLPRFRCNYAADIELLFAILQLSQAYRRSYSRNHVIKIMLAICVEHMIEARGKKIFPLNIVRWSISPMGTKIKTRNLRKIRTSSQFFEIPKNFELGNFVASSGELGFSCDCHKFIFLADRKGMCPHVAYSMSKCFKHGRAKPHVSLTQLMLIVE